MPKLECYICGRMFETPIYVGLKCKGLIIMDAKDMLCSDMCEAVYGELSKKDI